MRTTIDAAGRIVVPKALRDAMQFTPGQQIDIVFSDGRLEIEVAPTLVHVRDEGGLPTVVPDQQLPELSADAVRDVLEETRR